MSEVAFTILVVFTLLGGGVKSYTMPCPDMHCVERIEEQARESPFLQRFQAFRNDSYGRIAETGKTIFPPIIDWSRF